VVFGFHRLAVRDCVEHNQVAKVHAYSDHVFIVLHAPERGRGGTVHHVELDQFIGPGFLVTVHGPLDPALAPEVALRETRAVRQRVESGRLRPATSFELSYAIVSAVARHQEAFVATLAQEAGLLEQRLMADVVDDPEQFLEELFRARHELLVVRTMATLAREIYGRMVTLERFVPGASQSLVVDLADQFARVNGLADGQKDFLDGVIEFYQTRTNTKMTIAAWPRCRRSCCGGPSGRDGGSRTRQVGDRSPKHVVPPADGEVLDLVPVGVGGERVPVERATCAQQPARAGGR